MAIAWTKLRAYFSNWHGDLDSGAVAIGIGDFSFSFDQDAWDGAALLAAMFYSVYLLIIEKLRVRFSTSTILLWRCAVGAAFVSPCLLFCWRREQIFPHTVSGWASVLAWHWFVRCSDRGLLAQSLSQLSSSFVATDRSPEPADRWHLFHGSFFLNS
ncbi:MAG UNVERIFIED_CONTAM: EamA family transporter [Microcystis novacekii LVE1205-3]